ncbi:hypothetical protein B0T19DRAFT_468334 [Cercophora scortea]|uniref:Uncharacterized protein n=1 Tax=Cercophora scortea TaxID=314031 RepID=A0AAE0I7X8_9PEZI|nr:hypothetical protein B0T19DRAFT_468334 [Cercophora scortea]
MAASIPIASFGNNSQVAQDIRTKLQPEYDVVHICLTLEAALAELPLIFSGALDTDPSSKLGSNAETAVADRKVPLALIFGGGLPEDQIKAVKEAVLAKAPNAKPIVITRQDIFDAGGKGPDPDLICRLLREKLAASEL